MARAGPRKVARYGEQFKATAVKMSSLTGVSGSSPEMALRLSKALGRSPESWLAMQYNHDFWHAKRRVKLSNVKRLKLTAA